MVVKEWGEYKNLAVCIRPGEGVKEIRRYQKAAYPEDEVLIRS